MNNVRVGPLSRRAFLRGAGAVLALPALETISAAQPHPTPKPKPEPINLPLYLANMDCK